MGSLQLNGKEPFFTIPKECKAGVVVNEGPDFHVEVQMVPVPEPGSIYSYIFHSILLDLTARSSR